jgi:hypothetical protein
LNTVLDRIEDLRIAGAKIGSLARYDRWSDLTGAAVGSMAASAMLSVETLALVNSPGVALEWIGRLRNPAALGKSCASRPSQN